MSERKANCKKRDAGDAEFEAPSTSFTSLKRMRLVTDSVDFDESSSMERKFSPATSSASDSGGSSAGENDDHNSSVCSGCSSSETNEIAKDNLKVVDLEAPQISETEISACITINFREERTSGREFLEQTAEMDSKSAAVTAKARRDRRKQPAVSKSPTEDELEEFFSGAEKYEQKRFAEKYNYDVVKDAPLEGRYQWVRLKP